MFVVSHAKNENKKKGTVQYPYAPPIPLQLLKGLLTMSHGKVGLIYRLDYRY